MTKTWPEGTNVIQQPGTRPGECLCSVAFYAPEAAGIRPLYITDKGWVQSTWFCHGYGTTESEAEAAAHKKYEEIVGCRHDIERIAHVDHDDKPVAYLLDGDSTCNKCGLYLPFYFMDNRLHRSMNLATRGHEKQKRKYGDRPYIVHPRQVYNRTAFWKPYRPDEERIVMGCAAWMHDLLEDCPQITVDEIREAGGEQALQLVYWLTNPSKGVKKPRAYRKQMDRDHIATAPHPAKIIKLFDRICNLGDMAGCPEPDFIRLYAQESRQLLESVKDADEKLAAELARTIDLVETNATQTS